MRSISCRPLLFTAGIVALTLLSTIPALGADKPFVIRATGQHLTTDLDYKGTNDDGSPIEVRSGADTGWGIGFEYLATRRLGIAFQYATADPKLTLELDASPDFPGLISRTSLGMTSYAASLNFHLTPDRVVDVYLSPVAAQLSFDDVTFAVEFEGQSDSARFKVKDDLTWGIGVGMDIPFGESGWLATASVNYLASRLEFVEAGEQGSDILDFDPLTISAGVGYKF